MQKIRFYYSVAILLLCCTSLPADSDDRMNVLLIVSEDHSADLGCYGDRYARTPNLDRLATEGVLFENAYVTQSVCSPSRGTIFTGLYPHQNGQIGLATHNYAMYKPWPTSYRYMKEAGFRTCLLGKTHVNPQSCVENYVDTRAIRDANFSKRGMGRYAQIAGEFMREDNKPFFITINFPDAHWPVQNQVEGRPQSPQGPETVEPMDFIAFDNERMDTPIQGYYNCLQRLDECVGEILTELQKSGKAEQTVVIFFSDHGAQMGRGKTAAYEGGVRVPCIIRWPGVTQAGKRTEALWSTIDLLPTLLDIARVEIPDYLPGRSTEPLLSGDCTTGDYREYLFTEWNAASAALYYPQRTVRDDRYKLILSQRHEALCPAADHYLRHVRSHWTGSPNYDELKTAEPRTQEIYERFMHPDRIELYDLKTDPWEFTNRADDPALADVKARLLAALEKWQVDTKDPFARPELERRHYEESQAVIKAGRRTPVDGWDYVERMNPDNF